MFYGWYIVIAGVLMNSYNSIRYLCLYGSHICPDHAPFKEFKEIKKFKGRSVINYSEPD